MLILFGGGDGGGIWIGADGKIHRIPPWTPDVLVQLKAVSALVTLAAQTHEPAITKDAGAFAERVATAVIPKAVKIAGATQLGENSVAFFDPDGGFVCGSTGKHPIPIPPHSFGGTLRATIPTFTAADAPATSAHA